MLSGRHRTRRFVAGLGIPREKVHQGGVLCSGLAVRVRLACSCPDCPDDGTPLHSLSSCQACMRTSAYDVVSQHSLPAQSMSDSNPMARSLSTAAATELYMSVVADPHTHRRPHEHPPWVSPPAIGCTDMILQTCTIDMAYIPGHCMRCLVSLFAPSSGVCGGACVPLRFSSHDPHAVLQVCVIRWIVGGCLAIGGSSHYTSNK